jgi:hypothetical protein
MTRLRAGQTLVRIPTGVGNVFLSKRLNQRYSLQPSCLVGTRVLYRDGRDVNLTIHFDLISKSRMSEAICHPLTCDHGVDSDNFACPVIRCGDHATQYL